MSNIITKVFERIKITNPFRNEKAGYFLMHDADTGEVSAVPEAAILAKVNNRIDGIIYPDGFTKTTEINRVGNTVTIAPLDFEWRIQLNPYTNADEYTKTFDATESSELKRIDTLAATTEGTIVYYKGEEDEFFVKPPRIPTTQLRLSDFSIFGDEVQEHTEPIVSEVYTLAEKEKLAILDPTADIDKPVSTEQAAADATTLATAQAYAADLITQIINGAPADGDTLKELNDKIIGLQAIVGGTTPDGDSVVNTVTELLAVFAAFPEGVDVATLINGKVDKTDIYNALDCVVSGKVADARTVKTLNDLISALTTVVGSKEDTSNKTDDIEGNKTSSIKFTSAKAIVTWVLNYLLGNLTEKTTTLSDTDMVVIGDLADSGKTKKSTWANIKDWLLDFFRDQIEINTSTATVSNSWHGKLVIFTVNCTVTVPSSLRTNLAFEGCTLASVTVGWAITSPKTWQLGTPGSIAEKSTFSFFQRNSTNNIVLYS